MKKRILVFCDFYLPGFRSGGGMWTVVNLVERFADRYDFHIVTRNHDGRSDPRPYSTVETDAWNDIGNAKVYYASDRNLNTRCIARLVTEVAPDIIFLNSAFSTPVLKFLNARRKKLIDDIAVVLAPCGELSDGSLSLKPWKKKSFLAYSRLFGLYDRVIWKATTELEEKEIERQIGTNAEVLIAPDLAPKTILPDLLLDEKPLKQRGSVRLSLVSRLMRKKNVLFLLERLQQFPDGKISLELIGPIEDTTYWKECESAISGLPRNITVDVVGALPQPEILRRLVNCHFFVLPTLSENFGYVFIEAMAAGCPLLISDRTVWNDIDERGTGWVAPLDEPQLWIERLGKCVDMDDAEFRRMSNAARVYAIEWLELPDHEKATDRVLNRALAIQKQFVAADAVLIEK